MSKILEEFNCNMYCNYCKKITEHNIQKVNEEINTVYIGYYRKCDICKEVSEIDSKEINNLKKLDSTNKVKFLKGYDEEDVRINEGIVNNKPYKVYFDNKGYVVDLLGNLSSEELSLIQDFVEKSATKSERMYDL